MYVHVCVCVYMCMCVHVCTSWLFALRNLMTSWGGGSKLQLAGWAGVCSIQLPRARCSTGTRLILAEIQQAINVITKVGNFVVLSCFPMIAGLQNA